MLFSSIIFGPIKSRRLGNSLGINLLPADAKICSFDCIYCECGLNDSTKKGNIPTREAVKNALSLELEKLKKQDITIDTITFAGNGEPTMHPDFKEIIDDTLIIRNQLAPDAVISVLSNAWHITNPKVYGALLKVDNNILKLDSAIKETILQINHPNNTSFEVSELIANLASFQGQCIIQTLFVKGNHKGNLIDNTTEEEINAWLNALKTIQPKQIMIYSIDRETPIKSLEKIPSSTLKAIASQAKKLGFNISVSV
ncbi:MAG: radical SAM protein [Paludibacteraceae bacterium]|nr:radical SAM protein [Paludibacteraceae bacterium]